MKRIKLNINKIPIRSAWPSSLFNHGSAHDPSLNWIKISHSFLPLDANHLFLLSLCIGVKKKKPWTDDSTSNVTRLSLIKSGDANDKRWIKLGGGEGRGEGKEGRKEGRKRVETEECNWKRSLSLSLSFSLPLFYEIQFQVKAVYASRDQSYPSLPFGISFVSVFEGES